MGRDDRLSEDRRKRDPDRTPEPDGVAGEGAMARFVIQQHDAPLRCPSRRRWPTDTLKVWLQGEKLAGGDALTRLGGRRKVSAGRRESRQSRPKALR